MASEKHRKENQVVGRSMIIFCLKSNWLVSKGLDMNTQWQSKEIHEGAIGDGFLVGGSGFNSGKESCERFLPNEDEHSVSPLLKIDLGDGIRSINRNGDLEKYSDRVKRRETEMVDRAKEFLNGHIDKKFTLGDVAKSVGTNRSKLASTFKTVCGVSVFEWIREQRLQAARNLLLTTDLSIQQVACEVGYDSGANFSTAYKKRFNRCPRSERSIG